MLAKRTKQILIAIAVLSLAAAVLWGWRGSSLPLRHVTEVLQAGAHVYGIDQGEEIYRFFETDETGAILSEIRRDVRDGDAYRSYDCLTADGDTVYVLERLADIQSDLILSETVYRCDFERGRLETAWELPIADPSMDSNFAVQVRNGVLTFFQADYTGRRATGSLMTMGTDGQAEELTSFPYDIGVGFTDFYYSASGAVAFTTPAGEIYVLDEEGEARRRFPTVGDSFPLVLLSSDGGDTLLALGTDGKVYGPVR